MDEEAPAEDEQIDSDNPKFCANFENDTMQYPEGALRILLKVSYKLSSGEAWANMEYESVIGQTPWEVCRS